MKRHTHLTCEQRYLISNGLKAGYSQPAIANIIGVNKSAISREIRRNGASRGRVRRRTAGAGAYRPAGARKQAMARRVGKSKARIGREDRQLIEWLLHGKWSPERISLRLGKTGRLAVSLGWIRRHIRNDKHHGDFPHKHLRCRKGGGSATAARCGGARSPIGCPSSSARRWWSKEPASAIGSWTRCMGKAIPP